MELYNTLTGRVEPIAPVIPGQIKMYSCGPTVYRYIHIGNLRTFIMADWLRRALLYQGYEVFHVKNITDVGHMRLELLDRGEDKLIAQARKEGKSAAEIASFYTAAFFEDEACLNILPAHVFPRATEHVPMMIDLIKGLLDNGKAYFSDGNVYYAVTAFPGYGKLSGNQITRLLEGVRDRADLAKRNPEDFLLWKKAEPERELAWDSPWGRGTPGWHIECSAMSMYYLGPCFDIHTGGIDNIFPHHEDEIAQSEGYTGRPFVNIWVHGQHLLVDGLKMAKSTGNVYTRADVEARGFEPLALRYLFTTAHYRSKLNFTFKALDAAQTALNRLRAAVTRLSQIVSAQYEPSSEMLQETSWHRRFVAAISHDLNLPRAVGVGWEMIRDKETSLRPDVTLALLLDFDRILGFDLSSAVCGSRRRTASLESCQRMNTRDLIPDGIVAQAQQRERFRREHNFAAADQVRLQIAEAGYSVADTPTGSVIERRIQATYPFIARSTDVPDQRAEPDHYDLSINLLARDSRDDLERCIRSIARHRAECDLEIVVVDNGSTDDTLPYLQELVRSGVYDETGHPIPLHVLFADHNMGFAAGRNATMRASRGRIIVLLDTAIELCGDIWALLSRALTNPSVGLVGAYGLVTTDLKEFYLSDGPAVDAVEGYLMAFRRSLLSEVGWAEEKFRFYRLLDIYYSFLFKAAGYHVLVVPELASLLHKHPHREWFCLTEEERADKSKKNYDLFKRRWHHGWSLLVANFVPGSCWFGHDHRHHLGAEHTHTLEDLPDHGQPHSHPHQHWPDHAHEHPHYHLNVGAPPKVTISSFEH